MTLQFWQGWPRINRIFFLAFFTLFAAALVWMWAAWFMEPAPAIHLQTISEADITEIPVDQFSKGPFDFTIKGNNYVILQRELGSLLTTSETVAYVYLFVLAVFVAGMLAVISTLGKFYYLVGMGVFILFVTTLTPEVLGVFGNYGKTFTIIIMGLYAFASFWFFYFATTASFGKRVLAFSAITVFLWALIYFVSATEKPFLHIATYGAKAGLIACGLFIVTVSHEIVAAFVYAVTQSPQQRKSLNQFLIVSVVYLINLALAYSTRFGFIKWNIITVDLFLLLTISAILGIWGIRQRQKTYEGVIDADPYSVFAFLLTGAFAFATIGMFMLNANDTALSAISDIIIFTHIGFGFIFLTYVFSNFAGMLAQNYQVWKVLYSPNNMPYFTFRFAGVIATIALAIYNTWQVPVNNAVSGYYNGLGDLYLKLQNTQIAKAYYDESRTRGFHGHHANYALANIEGALFNGQEEHQFYNDACGPRPTQMSFLNLAQTYQATNDDVGAILALKDGAKRLTEHDALDNTIGLLYAKAGATDSAMKYIAKGSTVNTIGLAALHQLKLPDTALTISNDPIMKANQLALMNSLSKTSAVAFDLPKDTVLSLAEAAAISNYLINSRGKDDTTFVNKVISLARRSSNYGFKEAILYASAINLYNSGETKAAFTTLEEVTVTSQHQGKYNNTLTMWALENNEPQRAFSYADFAVAQDYTPGKLTHAVALTEVGQLKDAGVEWDSLRTRGDSITSVLANQLYHALSSPRSTLAVEEIYAYVKYRLGVADSAQIFEIVPTIPNDNIKARILLDLAHKLYALDKPSAAVRSLQRIAGLELTDASIGNEMQVLELLARVRMGEASQVIIALKQNPVAFGGKNKKYRVYFDALAAEDSTTASVYYRWLGNANPFFEDGVIAAADYFRKKGTVSYDLLAEAVQYHPSSVRIRKAYALESARRGFETYATNALNDLQPKISAKDLSELTQQVKALLAVER